MPDMGDLSGTVEGTGPGGPSADPGSSVGNNGGGNDSGGGNGPSSSQAGVSLETVSAVGLAAVAAVTAATAGSPMAIAVGALTVLGAAGFVMEHGGLTIGNPNAPNSPTMAAIGTAAILASAGVSLNVTETESQGMFDAMGGNDTVAIQDIEAGMRVFDPIGAEYNATLNSFLVSIPGVDLLLQNTLPGNAILLTASGALGVTNASVAEVDTEYGSADGGALNIWLPNQDLVTFTPDLQTMSVMRVSDWVNSYSNELKPDGFPTTVAALMYDRAIQNPTLGAPEPGNGGSG